MTTLTLQVSAVQDGAYERGDAAFFPDSTFISVRSNTNITVAGYRCAGSRFQNVTIPPGSTIDSASLTLVTSNTNATNVPRMDIHAESRISPPDFALASDPRVIGRTRSTASVNWTSATSYGFYATVTTPDIKAVIQEAVDQTGWQSGQALVILWIGRTDVGGSRFDFDSYGATAANAPLLTINYTPPVSGGVTVQAGAVSAQGQTSASVGVGSGSGVAAGNISQLIDYTSGVTPYYDVTLWPEWFPSSESFAIVSDPAVGGSGNVARFRWRPSFFDGTADSKKAEIKSKGALQLPNPAYPAGWVAIRRMYTSSFNNTNMKSINLSLIRYAQDPGRTNANGPCSFDWVNRGGQMVHTFEIKGASNDASVNGWAWSEEIILPAVPFDEWFNVVIQYKFSTTGDGYCRLWWNDVLTVERTNILFGDLNTYGEHFKHGVYVTSSTPDLDYADPTDVYISRFVIAKSPATYEEVRSTITGGTGSTGSGGVTVLAGAATATGTTSAAGVATGALTLSAAIVQATGATINPSAVKGALTIAPAPSSASGETATGVVVTGALTLAPPAATASAATTDPAVTRGALAITPATVSATGETGGPLVARGAVTVLAGAAVAQGTTAAPGVGIGALAVYALPATASTATENPTVARGALTTTPDSPAATGQVVAPSVTRGALSILAAAATATGSTVAPVAATGALTLTPAAAAVNTQTVAPATVRGALALQPSPTTALTATAAPSVFAGGTQIVGGLVSASTATALGAVVRGALLVTVGAVEASSLTTAPVVVRGALTLTPAPLAATGDVSGATVDVSGLFVSTVAAIATSSTLVLSVIRGPVELTGAPSIAATATNAPAVIRAALALTPPAAIATVAVGAPLVDSPDLVVVPTSAPAATATAIGQIELGALLLAVIYASAAAQTVNPVVRTGLPEGRLLWTTQVQVLWRWTLQVRVLSSWTVSADIEETS